MSDDLRKSSLSKWERHEHILRMASERGIVHLDRAMEATGASRPTLRRDFQELEAGGSIERVRGGIRVIRREGSLPFNLREVRHSAAKSAIAQKAARLLRAGDVLFIDGGTTTYHLCLCLPKIPLRIITNSLRVSAYLDDPAQGFSDWEIYLTGGYIQRGSNMLTGPGTLHSLDFYHADWAFLSIGGISTDGLYNTSEAVVETERKMIDRCDRAVILADQSKFGKRAMCRLDDPRRVDRIITDPHPGRSLVEEALVEQGCRVIHADPPKQPARQ
ncbi:MAG: DeoR/GlpR family DNA-binding transcription regulator [Opitutales bacterium]